MKNPVAILMMKVCFFLLLNCDDILMLIFFGNIILMLILFNQFKTPQRKIQIISQIIPQKVCQPPPRKKKIDVRKGYSEESSSNTDDEGKCFGVSLL